MTSTTQIHRLVHKINRRAKRRAGFMGDRSFEDVSVQNRANRRVCENPQRLGRVSATRISPESYTLTRDQSQFFSLGSEVPGNTGVDNDCVFEGFADWLVL